MTGQQVGAVQLSLRVTQRLLTYRIYRKKLAPISFGFDDVSGEFFFGNTSNNAGASLPYNQIGLIGDFNGWSTDVFLIQNPNNTFKWSAKVNLATSGGAKFRANGAWTTSWGGSAFPNGAGTTNNDPNITIPLGTYQITFNSATGEYTFTN